MFAAAAGALAEEPLLDSPSLLDSIAHDPLVREALSDRRTGLDLSPWEMLFPQGQTPPR